MSTQFSSAEEIVERVRALGLEAQLEGGRCILSEWVPERSEQPRDDVEARYRDISEQLAEAGLKFRQPYLEHDHVSGEVVPAGDYTPPRHTARSMYESNLPPFIVSGGPFARAQTMGLHLTNERGLTVGVLCERRFAERVNTLEELAALLRRAGAAYHLTARRDAGYLDDLDEQSWERLRRLLKEL